MKRDATPRPTKAQADAVRARVLRSIPSDLTETAFFTLFPGFKRALDELDTTPRAWAWANPVMQDVILDGLRDVGFDPGGVR